MSTLPEPDEGQRRRLTAQERIDLLGRPLAGVLSTLSPDGHIHSVPVHFLYRDPDIRVLCGLASVKARNVARTGRATLCVEVTDGADRRYVSVAGAARLECPPALADLLALDERYGRTDFAPAVDDPDSAMLVLLPGRWIAWSDSD